MGTLALGRATAFRQRWAGDWPFVRGMVAASALIYALILSRFSFDPFGAEPFGLVYNSMLDHMLRGRWDVDPASIGFEAFVRDGRSYAYFGPFPALLRLPLLLWSDWQDIHIERLSCWLAAVIGISAQIRATLRALASTARDRLTPPLAAAVAFSGAPMLLVWKGALIYHEAVLWSWALAMCFVALALPVLPQAAMGRGRLCAMATFAGLCLLTRVTTGAGLCLATLLLLIRQGVVSAERWRSVWGPASVLAFFVGLAGMVNWGRWGNPLVFADLRLQTVAIATFPDRLQRLERYGTIDWRRFDLGALYYFFPVWTDWLQEALPLTARVHDLLDAAELPASSLLLTDPVWCLLAACGLVALVGGRAERGEALLAAGLALAPALMLSAWSMTFRYRAEFEPLLLVLACIGLRQQAAAIAGSRGRLTALWLLCLLQTGGAMDAGLNYAQAPFGPSVGHTAFDPRCAVSAAACSTPSH